MTNNFLSDSEAEYFAESHLITNKVVAELWAFAKTDKQKAELKKLGFVRNKYEEKAGKLTFAERKVNFESIERSFDVVEGRFLAEVKILADKEKKIFLKDLKKLLDKKEYTKIAALEMKYEGKLAKSYSGVMKDFFDIGKKTASDEMGVKAPATSKDVSGVFRGQAITFEEKMGVEASNTGKDEALYSVNKGLTDAEVLKQTEKALDQKIPKILNASTTQSISGAFNTGRTTVFEAFPEKIYGFQYTAVLDHRTTNLCLSLNGRVVSPTSKEFYQYMPPNHIRCRSMWVAIDEDEFIKPKIEGIPKSIPSDRTGYTTFRDLKKPKIYKPKEAPTPEEKKIVTEGIIKAVKDTLGGK